jgi:hypothetical protein
LNFELYWIFNHKNHSKFNRKFIKANIPLRIESWVILNFHWKFSLKIQYGKTITLNIPLRIEFWVILNFQWQKSLNIQYLPCIGLKIMKPPWCTPMCQGLSLGTNRRTPPFSIKLLFFWILFNFHWWNITQNSLTLAFLV